LRSERAYLPSDFALLQLTEVTFLGMRRIRCSGGERVGSLCIGHWDSLVSVF